MKVEMEEMTIQVRNVSKRFGNYQALKDIHLEIPDGKLVALLGPSGSGKTTLLRIIAGLESVDEGAILFEGEDVTHIHVKQRQVGFVFQHYALFKHMTVFENIAFGLKVRKRKERLSSSDIKETVHELLSLVKLEGFADRYPSQLSGGQRQRVALARALAVKPKILLLDEPFGALDAKVRKELRRWLRKLHDEVHITSVFVTHDQEEALDVADQIVVMNEGKIVQTGTPDEVYDHPATPFVYDFLGHVNIFHGRVNNGKFRIGQTAFEVPAHLNGTNEDAVGYVRPHQFTIEKERKHKNSLTATIRFCHSIGPVVYIEVEVPNSEELVEIELRKEEFSALNLKIGQQVYIHPREVRVFLPCDFGA